eukprot:GHRQ01033982.1.p1 GENE.GHRQ01033982.1~~GHRQ01033982.1.p1  ORF type:complete len:132 (+),score=22.17 GHRQ01033982.1:899-1294(+)
MHCLETGALHSQEVAEGVESCACCACLQGLDLSGNQPAQGAPRPGKARNVHAHERNDAAGQGVVAWRLKVLFDEQAHNHLTDEHLDAALNEQRLQWREAGRHQTHMLGLQRLWVWLLLEHASFDSVAAQLF